MKEGARQPLQPFVSENGNASVHLVAQQDANRQSKVTEARTMIKDVKIDKHILIPLYFLTNKARLGCFGPSKGKVGESRGGWWGLCGRPDSEPETSGERSLIKYRKERERTGKGGRHGRGEQG